MKLTYYKEHKWENRWIKEAKAHITELYQSEYAPAPAPEDDDEYAGDDDDYRASLFKKRRVARANELDDYLNAEIALPGTQILEWWQV